MHLVGPHLYVVLLRNYPSAARIAEGLETWEHLGPVSARPPRSDKAGTRKTAPTLSVLRTPY